MDNPTEFPRTVILRKGGAVTAAPPFPDGRPAWRVEYGTEREPARSALVADPALAAWFSTQRHTDVMRVGGHLLPDGVALIERVEPLGMPALSVSPAPDLSGLGETVDGPLAGFGLRFRAYMEEVAWPDWLDTVSEEPSCLPGACPAFGMCRATTVLALAVLKEHDPDGDWEPDGGHPTQRYWDRGKSQFRAAYKDVDGGMWDRVRDAWDGHYWLRSGRDGTILDLTADQFGWEPVIVTPQDDMRYRASYRPATVLKDLRGSKTAAWGERHAAGWEAWCAERGEDPAPAGEGP